MLRRWRLTGVLYAVLVVVSATAAVTFAKVAELDAAETIVAILPTVAPLFLAWRAFREDRSDLEQAVTAENMLDQLAVAVRKQWEAEVRLRGVDDPHPLPLSWHPAPAGLFDEQIGPQVRGDAHADLGALLGAGLNRRLVVLGDPGAGKTVLLVQIVLDLVEARKPGQPVPVLFPLASWDPLAVSFPDWIRQRLEVEHPSLLLAAPPSLGRESIRSQALIDRGLIFPVLDGLDELPVAVRGRAIQEINSGLGQKQGLVLSSRVAEFREAVQLPGARWLRIRRSAGVQLTKLAPDVVAAYLERDADDPYLVHRWSGVFSAIRWPGPLRSAIETPLMVTLARAIYNPRPGQTVSGLPEPQELCDPHRFPTRQSIEQHLFDGFVRLAYQPSGSGYRTERQRGTPRAVRWLRELARHLEEDEGGNPDLRWWRLPDAMSRAGLGCLTFVVLAGTTALMLLLPVGTLAGADSAAVPWLLGLSLALGAGGAIACVLRSALRPAQGLRWSRQHARLALTLGAAAAVQSAPLLAAVAFSLGNSIAAGMIFGVLGLLSGVFFALVIGMRPAPADLSATPTPTASIREDRRAFLVNTLVLGVALGGLLGVSLGLIVGAVTRPPRLEYAGRPDLIRVREVPAVINGTVAVYWAYVGVVLGLSTGVVISLARSAWGSYALAYLRLGAAGRLPWRLTPFLRDAHLRRGILRQAGPVYQFRHIELQRRLARQHRDC